MKHTPGPWKAQGTFIGTDEKDYQTIAYVSDHRNREGRSIQEHHANARLIAKSPVMLELIKDALACLENLDAIYNFGQDYQDDADREATDTIEKLKKLVSDIGE